MRIKVTRDHINNGQSNNETSCPIALACKEAGLGRPFVGANMSFDYNGAKYSIGLPTVAIRFITDFDEYRHVEAFEFDIDI